MPVITYQCEQQSFKCKCTTTLVQCISDSSSMYFNERLTWKLVLYTLNAENTTTAPSSCSALKSTETPTTILWLNFVTKMILWHLRIQKTRKEIELQGTNYFLQIPKKILHFSYVLWRVGCGVFSCFVGFFKLGSVFLRQTFYCTAM